MCNTCRRLLLVMVCKDKCAEVRHSTCPFSCLKPRRDFPLCGFGLRLWLFEALGPWLAAEIPYLIEAGVVTEKTVAVPAAQFAAQLLTSPHKTCHGRGGSAGSGGAPGLPMRVAVALRSLIDSK